MKPDEWYECAYRVAIDAHAGQVDKNGEPYIRHPVAVANILRNMNGSDLICSIALMHDVLEDSSLYDEQKLIDMGFPLEIVDAVVALTRRRNEPPDLYYERVKRNDYALMVKMADIQHNLQPDRLHKLDTETQQRLRKKYLHALEILMYNRKET